MLPVYCKENLTKKAEAQDIVARTGHNAIEPEHLFRALLDQEGIGGGPGRASFQADGHRQDPRLPGQGWLRPGLRRPSPEKDLAAQDSGPAALMLLDGKFT